MVLESEETEVHVEDKPEEHYFGPGITQVLTTEGFGAVFRDEKVLAFEEQLLMLAKTKIDDKCLVKGCSESVAISTKYVGTALYIIWVCTLQTTCFQTSTLFVTCIFSQYVRMENFHFIDLPKIRQKLYVRSYSKLFIAVMLQQSHKTQVVFTARAK